MQNVLVTLFNVKSEAYQAFSELKAYKQTENTLIGQAVLVQRNEQGLSVIDAFDPMEKSVDGALTGGLLGALVGILGGPLGMLFGGSVGALIGDDAGSLETLKDSSLVLAVSNKLKEGDVAVIVLAQEENEAELDALFAQFQAHTLRWDAAVIQSEVEDALEVQIALREQAKERLADLRARERKEKLEAFKENIKGKFNELSAKIKNSF